MKRIILGVTVVIGLLMTSGKISNGADFTHYIGTYKGFTSINEYGFSKVEIGEIEAIVTPLDITLRIASGYGVEEISIPSSTLERGSLLDDKHVRSYDGFEVFREKTPLPFKFVFGETRKGKELIILFPTLKKRPTILMSEEQYEKFLGDLGDRNVDCCLPRLAYGGKLKGG